MSRANRTLSRAKRTQSAAGRDTMHSKRLALALAACALASAAVPAFAGSELAGTTAANFLAVGAGPGVLAMGGAALGCGGSLEHAAWNPAALGWVDATALELSHAQLDDQAMQEWATLGGRFGHSGTHWAMSALYHNEGTIIGRDASNLPTGDFTTGSVAAMVQLAQRAGPHAAFGVTGKYVVEALGPGESGTGMTFDAGMSLRFGVMGFGFAAQNVGGRMSYGESTYPFPASYGAGVSFAHEASGVVAAADLNVPSASFASMRTGVQWTWRQHVAVRAGYRQELGAPAIEPLSGPTFGTGLGMHGMWLDYAFLLDGNMGGQHRLAISLRPSALGIPAGNDPFGQRAMPREFSDAKPLGPPAPKPTASDAR